MNGEMDAALADYNRAIARDPRAADAYFNRGVSWKAKGELGRAESDMSRVIVLNPHHAEAYCIRALVLLQQGKDTAAQDDFERCLALDVGYKDSLEQKIEELRSQLAARR
jgi:tetratricopeptide (TPR) repeat protein